MWGTESLGKLPKVTQVLSGETIWFEPNQIMSLATKAEFLSTLQLYSMATQTRGAEASQPGETASAQAKKDKVAWAISLDQSDWNIGYVCMFPKNRLWAKKLCLSDFFFFKKKQDRKDIKPSKDEILGKGHQGGTVG